MSPDTRQRPPRCANNTDALEKIPLLKATRDAELQATGHQTPRNVYQPNGSVSKPISDMVIRMRLRPGPNGPRLSFLTVLRDGAKKKSGSQMTTSHVENMHPDERRRDWMRRLRPKAHRCVSQ